MLLKENECPIDQVEVMCGTWDRTLIRLRESELQTSSLYAIILNHASQSLQATASIMPWAFRKMPPKV